jgi:RNA polymerase-binding transcription factor DksA
MIDELLKDFKESLKKIDFNSYNPNSNEFKTALFLGLMWEVMSELDDEIENEPSEIDDEIKGAKKYLQKYLDTKDSQFHKMTSDEIDHATFLIKKESSKLLSTEEKAKLKHYENILNQIKSML